MISVGFKINTYHRYIFLFFLFSLFMFFFKPFLVTGTVLGATSSSSDFFTGKNIVDTKTAFDQEERMEYVEIPYETEYKDNYELEYGMEEVLREGQFGLKTLTYLVTFWQDDIIDKTLIDTKTDPPISEIISLNNAR